MESWKSHEALAQYVGAYLMLSRGHLLQPGLPSVIQHQTRFKHENMFNNQCYYIGEKPFLIHREYTIITTHRDINYHLKVSKFTGSLYVSIISSIQASQPPQAVSAATRPAEPSENGRDHWFA